MQTPWEVANARLARGEISTEDHAAIIARLGPPPLPGRVPGQPPPLPAAPVARRTVWPWIAGGAGLVFVLLLLIGLSSVDGLSVGNLQADGSRVKFKIANTGSKSGDVILWIEQAGNSMCERITHVSANMSYNIWFDCPSLRAGNLTLHHQWASFDAAKAAVAERIK